MEEPEGADAVVQRDDDDVSARGDSVAAVERCRSTTGREGATMEPDHYGATRIIGRRREHVELQAVFAHRHVEGESQQR